MTSNASTTVDPFAAIVVKAEEIDVKSPTKPALSVDDIPASVRAVVDRSMDTGKIVRLTFADADTKAHFAEFARGYALVRPAGRAAVRFVKAADDVTLNVRATEWKPREPKKVEEAAPVAAAA